MRVTLLSLSHIPSDGRIRRHADALLDAGHSVTAVGAASSGDWPTGFPYRPVPLPPWRKPEVAMQAARLLTCRLNRRFAKSTYWSSFRYRSLYEHARAFPADLYVANDWNTLPVAARLAQESGTRYAYDSHEYAVEERLDRLRWRLVWPPFLRALEGELIADAAWVTTVSDGIAEALQADYRLEHRPTVIRNAPPYQQVDLRPTSDVVTVLFHGGLHRDRGLEALIESVALWKPDRRLFIRGNGDPTYVSSLRERAQRVARDRIIFEPAVPPDAVVQSANRTGDIGIHPMPTISRQTRFALPNKFFEYTMAGLALCVVDGSEMAELSQRFGTGRAMSSADPIHIAEAINSFSRSDIDLCKRRSLSAAQKICWEHEKAALMELYAPWS